MRYVRRMHMCGTLYPQSHVHIKAYLSTHHTHERREWCKATIPRPRPFVGSTIANRLGSRYTLLRNSIVLFISRARRYCWSCIVGLLWIDAFCCLICIRISFKWYGTWSTHMRDHNGAADAKKRISNDSEKVRSGSALHSCTTEFSNSV